MKRKKSKSLINKSDLEPILEIVTRERDISKWPVDKLIDRTLGLFLDKDEAVNPDIVESVLDSLSKFQNLQKLYSKFS